MIQLSPRTVALIVAHPDDETLWAGGTVLLHPTWNWFVVSLCRGSDKDRSSRFFETLRFLSSEGVMGDLDDGPEQKPLEDKEVEQTIQVLLPPKRFDLVITHNPNGEYTRHLRHEEVSKAVIKLWESGHISTNELWTFAYEDGGGKYYPKPIDSANIHAVLTEQIWKKKYSIITEIYGFDKSSFEAETTPRKESFWRFTNSKDATMWLNNGGVPG